MKMTNNVKKILGNYELIINTTPVGTYPNTEECPNINFDYITKNHIFSAVTRFCNNVF